MCRKFIFLTSLMLMSGLTQAQTSYIIVHAVNPEGVEIASLEGGFSFSVEIFDGTQLIGWAPHDAETHNVPIPIAPGTHTIKAKFNGITKEQVIALNSGESKVLTFVFERTEFDIATVLNRVYSGDSSISYDYTFNWNQPYYPCYDFLERQGNYEVGYSVAGDGIMGTASGSATLQYDITSYYSYVRATVVVTDAYPSFPFVRNHIGIRPLTNFTTYEDNLIPSYSNFWDWYIQSVTSGEYPRIVVCPTGDIYFHEIIGGTPGYTMRIISTVAYDRISASIGASMWLDCFYWTVYPFNETRESVVSGTLSYLKMSSVPYDLLGTGIKCEGECAFSAENPVWENEDDEMVLPYDEVDMKFQFTNTAQNPVSNVRVGFLSNSELFTLIKGIEEIGPVAAGGTFTATNRMKVYGSDNETIMNEIIKVSGSGELSLEDAIEVMVTADECSTPCLFTLSPADEEGNILAVQYPQFIDTMDSCPAGDVGNFYLRGDDDFHHPDDDFVRKYAIEASVWPDSIFPDDVSDAVHNIYHYIDNLLGDRDPGIGDIDTNIAAKIKDGLLEPHPGGAKDEYHLCIGQAYLFGSFARTIGIPAREITVGLGKSIIQIDQHVYLMWYYQEAAIQVWCDGYWQFYDTFLARTSLDGYLERVLLDGKACIKYRSWYSYDHRDAQMPDWPWSGHNFWVDPLSGQPWIFTGWKHLQDGVKEGLIVVIGSPVCTYLCDAEDNTTGYVDGGILEEIPDSYYVPAGSRFSTNAADSTAFWEADETIFAPSSGSSGDYSLVMTGTDDGHYELTMAYIHGDGEIDGSTIPFDIHKDETHTYDITVSPSGEISITGIPARIDIEPDTMNLSAQGRWVTCYIELPEGFDVSLTDGSMVELDGIPAYIGKEDWAKAEANQWNITDHDEDGIPERMVKFDSFLVQLLAPGNVTLSVYGGLIDGTIFEGSDNIKVINPRAK